MVNKYSPSLKVLRRIKPDLEHIFWDSQSTCDTTESSEGTSPSNITLGEILDLKFVLSNGTKSKFSEVTLKVEIAMELANHEPEVAVLFEDLVLSPDETPSETDFSYTFERISQYRMTISLCYKTEKSATGTIGKVHTWQCGNPLLLNHKAVVLPDGRTYLETKVDNHSECEITLSNMRLINKADEICLFPMNKSENKGNNIYNIFPGGSYSIIFSKEYPKNHFDDFHVSFAWKSSTNESGSITSKVDAFNRNNKIVYKVIRCPSIVKINEPFNLQISVENTSSSPLNCSIKLDEKLLKPFFAQINDTLEVGKVINDEQKIVDIPLLCTSNGLCNVRGIEIHCGESIVSVDTVEILVL
ncbi:hypothetical protein BEWA_006160 [Theileria equi strain WA]|uniref:Trafficking protein particle complex subunit 13 C-terminal domain-containing protein n=1 Tax=Theileria equi strain WA TaxID=1537102 RepID=L0B025_THEEQ|nr:hypothetical protein BEWA_006160 [Theileria equi strain WA]AFZ81207.1 hypothetical protein BEWA_006160 [Theileria equi strain WA]|eukprot:XP_004830873.1 hypothetical protein BEWA_006160 [Theileria equi strain WA]